jgi:phosphoglycolate phosphatase
MKAITIPEKLRGIVFDLDGTLVHSSIDFYIMKKRMIKFLVDNGIPEGFLTPNQTTVVIMASTEKIFRENGHSEEEISRLCNSLEDIMNQGELEAISDVSEIEGVQKALKSLKDDRYKLAVLTRSHHAYAVKVLKKIGAFEYFDIILGRGETPKPKPYSEALEYTAKLLRLNLKEILFVGDNHIDASSSENANVPFIGVKTGPRGDQSWRNKIPKILLNSVAELPKFLASSK